MPLNGLYGNMDCSAKYYFSSLSSSPFGRLDSNTILQHPSNAVL